MASITDLFKCTVCDGSRVEEVAIRSVVRTEILSIDGAGNIEYGDSNGYGGRVHSIRCMDCGRAVARAGLTGTARSQEGEDNDG